MNILQMLSQKELAPILLVAGEKSGGREISSITMMDAPDIIPYLRKNELIITTAYHLQNNHDFFQELIREMATKGCAGIGIKKNRFLLEIPQDILQLADQLHLPFIELPEHLSLGQINFLMTEKILQSEASLLAHAMDIHRQFTLLILNGHGIPRLVRQLTSLIGRDVQLISPFLRPMYSAQQHVPELASIQKMMRNDFTYTTSNKAWTFSLIADRQTISLYPININSEKNCYLMIKGSIDEQDIISRLTIEQAINVLSFAIMQEQALHQQKRNIRNQHFRDLLEQEGHSLIALKAMSQELSLPYQQVYLCMIGHVTTKTSSYTYQPNFVVEQIHKFCEEALQASRIPIHAFTLNNELVFLYELHDPNTDYTLFLTELFSELETSIHQYFDLHMIFGVSNQTHNFSEIQRAYKEAQSTLLTIRNRKKLISFYKKKEINELLQMIPQTDLMNYHRMVFKAFSSLPVEEQKILFETLNEFLECHCQISETAKRLYVHRNTVIYRIEKCSSLLQKDLKDPEVTLQLRLALRIRNQLLIEQTT
ncbi:PucR family transcriptional regulator [Lysinibacillus sp. SGAir0095]|uniref:PucR family transcriptional regulator n=1 Tax=Lysinibacillus sp. SGAir0095 TaxID=2070463 RepID=UPI0010CCDEB3|nr:PucR family transcriptional regulator [Lysinibacillus sp. SGAir0095]QCR30984.1 PucR family transcriptional regulator [Lysinibacillus sp. SGAir0095]